MPLSWSQDAYITAYRFAAHAHRWQLVPGTATPYIMHLSFVSMEIIASEAAFGRGAFTTPSPIPLPRGSGATRESGRRTSDPRSSRLPGASTFNWDLAIQCALLHDVLEDTRVRYDQVREQFGQAVARGVLALTKDKKLPKVEQMPDCLQRIHQQPLEIWMVKLADRITNLQPPPPHWSKQKIREYHQEASVIHAALKDASPFLADRLEAKIQQYAAFVS